MSVRGLLFAMWKRAVRQPPRADKHEPPSDDNEHSGHTESSALVDAVKGLREAYETQQKKQRTDNNLNRLIAYVAAGIALGALVAAVFQWCEMRNATSLTRAALKVSSDTFKETVRSNETTQRAYVMVTSVDLVRERPPAGRGFSGKEATWGVRVNIDNAGQTPARITAQGGFIRREAPVAAAEQCPRGMSAAEANLVTLPKLERSASFRWLDPRLNDAIVWALGDRAQRPLTLYGMLLYTDPLTAAAGKTRGSTYCFYLSPLVNSQNTERFTWFDVKPKRTAFSVCSYCNAWDW